MVYLRITIFEIDQNILIFQNRFVATLGRLRHNLTTTGPIRNPCKHERWQSFTGSRNFNFRFDSAPNSPFPASKLVSGI